MRKTGPITQREFLLDDGATLVSSTNLKSRITYCNPAFVAVSGYAREELIGQPHNLIRHPDMPAEAFRDMWATLESGQPWTAVVRTVARPVITTGCANVTPVVEDGHIVGYMSVRTKPGRDEVAAAEALYARMRDEAAASRIVTTLQAGEVVVRTPAARRALAAARLRGPGHRGGRRRPAGRERPASSPGQPGCPCSAPGSRPRAWRRGRCARWRSRRWRVPPRSPTGSPRAICCSVTSPWLGRTRSVA